MEQKRNTELLSTGEDISLNSLIIKVKDWGVYLWHNWYIFLLIGLLGAGTGGFYAKSKKPIYTATTTFVLESGESNTGGVGQVAGLAALAGIDFGASSGGIFQGDNLLELYKSRKMIEAALNESIPSDSSVLMVDKYLEMMDLKEKWRKKKPELLEISFKRNKQNSLELQRAKDSVMNDVVANIRDSYLIVDKLDKKLSIIKVELKSNNEQFAKDFNEALVKKVNDFYVATKTRKSQENIEILQYKTDSVRAIMSGEIASAALVVDNTPNLNPTRQAQRIIPTQNSQFSLEANKAILSQLIQNLEMAKMSLLRETPLIQVIDDPVLPLSKKSISLIKGIFLGGILGVFITVFFLTISFVFRK